MRIGAVLLPQSFKNIFLTYKCCIDPYTSAVLQGALTIFIQNGMYAKHVNHMKNGYSHRIATLLQACEQLPTEIQWRHTNDCIFIFPDQIDFASLSANLQRKNVFIRGGEDWYLPDFEKKNGIRLCIYQTDEDQIIKAADPILIQ